MVDLCVGSEMLCRYVIGILVSVSFSFQDKILARQKCDMGKNTFMTEGHQGVLGRFPWLGIIRVTLYEGAKIRTAVTGAVLVTSTFAIANAEDIIKIPKKIFRDDTKVMFISSDRSTLNYELKGYTAHAEFKDQTLSTIALVELKFGDESAPLIPICWPRHYDDVSKKHYAVGYDDENFVLEKVAYGVQFVSKPHCQDYYNSIEVNDHQYVPTHYQCWMAPDSTQNCVWENGMVLVSNSSGSWVLIGIGIRGPGCAAPVRFIELHPYRPWIESVVNDAALRRSYVNQNIKPRLEDIPAHHFFRNADTETVITGLKRRINQRTSPPSYRKSTESDTKQEEILTPGKRGEVAYFKEQWFKEDIHRIDKDAIIIAKFGEKYEYKEGDCMKASYRVYRETTKVKSYPDIMGQASYKLSLIELEKYEYTCVLIRVKSRHRSDCYLWYSLAETIDEPVADEMPDHLLKHYIPVEERVTAAPFDENVANWEPHQNLEAYHLKDGDPFEPRWWTNKTMFNLFIKFDFREEAELMLEIWALKSPLDMQQLGMREEREKVRNFKRTRKPYHSNTPRRRPTTTTKKVKPKRTRVSITTVKPNMG